jgi:phage I-like protein
MDMAANFSNGAGKVLIDYEHNSLWGDTRAAGWVARVEARDDGLYMQKPNFTPNAQKMIDDGEYSYFSPTIQFKAKNNSGKKIGTVLHSVALTNLPFFQTEIDAIRNNNLEDCEMKFTDEQLEQLRKNYNLPADATEDDVQNAILNGAPVVETEAETEPEVEPEDDGGDPEVKNQAILDALNKINSRLDKIEQGGKRSNAEKLVDDAVANGKISPAQKSVYVTAAEHDYDGTKKVLDSIHKNAALLNSMALNAGKERDTLGDDDNWKKNSRNDAVDEIVNARAVEMATQA